MMKSHGKTRGGFSLAEMIVVCVIMGIAAAMVIPSAVGTTDLQARAAAQAMAGDLEYAQNLAVVTQADVAVAFSLTGNRYSISNASGVLKHPMTKKDFIVVFDKTNGYGNVRMTSISFGVPSMVTFNALGAPYQDGSVGLLAGTHAYTITVAPVTGRISATSP